MTDIVEQLAGAGEPRPLRLDRKPGEGLHGFVVRLAGLELCTASQMRRWLGLGIVRRRMTGEVARAAELCGMEVDEFERMGFESDGWTWIAGVRVPSRLAAHDRMRVCPACLAEDPYHRSIWEFASIDVCPIHRTRLIDRCPDEACGKLQTWDRWSVDTCSCGTKLASHKVSSIGYAGSAAAIVYDRCSLPIAAASLPAEFEHVPLEDLLDLMGFLGRMEILVVRDNPIALSRRKMSTDPQVVEVGAEIVLGWPEAFHELADRIKRARPNQRGARRFGSLHRFVGASPSRSFGPILLKAYRQFLVKDGMAPESLPEFLGARVDEEAYVGAIEAKKILGLSAALAARLKTTSLWQPIEANTRRRGKRKFLPRSEVEKLAGRLARAISFRQADTILGLKRGRSSGNVAKLVEAGLIEAIPFNEHREAHQMSVDRRDVEAMLTRIERHLVDVPPKDPVTFSDMFFRASLQPGADEPMAALFRSMMKGRLRGFVSAPDGVGLQRLTFERREGEAAVELISNTVRTRRLSSQDAAKILGVRTPMIHGLVEAGLLPKPTWEGNACLIERTPIEDFWARYESAQRLARQRRTTSAIIEEKLRSLRVKPVAIVKVDEGRRDVSIYRKRDVRGMSG